MALTLHCPPDAVARREPCRSRFDGLPTARKFSERPLIGRPFVQSSGVEIRPVRPYQRLDLRI
jgi:hypothetical protein